MGYKQRGQGEELSSSQQGSQASGAVVIATLPVFLESINNSMGCGSPGCPYKSDVTILYRAIVTGEGDLIS